MKKISILLTLFCLSLAMAPEFAVAVSDKHLEAKGEVLSVDPLYSRITIKHGAIQGFSGGPETEFFVTSADILKEINKRDLVDFVIVEEKGDSRIEKITKTGEAPPKEERSELGAAVQGALVATGEAAKAVTSPIPAANEVVSGAVGATTDTTGPVLENAPGPEVKQKF